MFHFSVASPIREVANIRLSIVGLEGTLAGCGNWQQLMLVEGSLAAKQHCPLKLSGKIAINVGRAWLAQFVRSLPSDHKVPGSIPGFAEIRIFVQPSFPPKQTQLSILPG